MRSVPGTGKQKSPLCICKVQVCGGLFCVLLLDVNEHCSSESGKYYDYFGWNIVNAGKFFH
ncbi:hypothetical protein COPEUT_02004 [Coprococcus eutactus ATCC 27759]|nr:hypothetical protein COPEUT_02004 [Coprococcus eutactus ATCC 27759]